MARYASGKYSLGECDICGLAYPLLELRRITENLILTQMMACDDCWVADHPQWQVGKNVVADAEILRDSRPDRRPADLTNIAWGWNPVYGMQAVALVGLVTITGDVVSTPSFVYAPSNEDLLVFDDVTNSEYEVAIFNAPLGAKRTAGAQALVNAFSPDHRLYIYRDGQLIVPIEYSGELLITQIGVDIYIELNAIDSAIASVSADIDTGMWTFQLQGGAGYTRTITGSVGTIGSGKPIELSGDIVAGSGVLISVSFVIPRSLDAIT